jgi:hypothetical protein
MSIAAIVAIVVVLAFVAIGIFNLRKSARTGMPPRDVLDRATRRARELEAAEKARDERGTGDF